MMPPFTRWLACLLLGAAALHAPAVQINRTSSTNFYVDFGSDMRCSYVAYMVTNTDNVNYSNLWVTIDSFTNSVVRLGGGDQGRYDLGSLAANQAKPVFFYLQATNQPATSQHTIKVFNGYPATGTLLSSSNFVLSVVTSGQNQANKVNSVVYSPTNSPVLGGLLKISVQGTTGNVAAGNDMSFSAATFTNWNAGAWELVACSIVITDSPNVVLTNILDTASTLHITGTGDPYQADYWVRAVAVTSSNTPVSPVSFVNNGGGSINHVQESSLLTLPPVIPSTNLTVLNSAVSYTQLYTNETLTLTLEFSNASSVDVTLDRVVDTLPAGFVYVTNSTTFNGSTLLAPTASGQVLSWSQPCLVPANSSRSFVFQSIPTVGGYATNAAVAFIKNSQIDTTLNTADNAPALQTIRALLQPTAVDDTATTPEDTVLTVPAPGVLANDAEPNTFSLAVVSYTQPAHGTVSVSSDGAYTYTPVAGYSGADSFTYTITNGNARASTATVSLSVLFVNHPPTLDPLGPVTLNEDASQQTVTLSGISAGSTTEAGQQITITASSSNPGLIPNPTVTYTSPQATGTLQFAPTPNSNGVATITVVLSDDGGTANGGVNALTNTFTVTVNALTTLWNTNGSLAVHVNDATGAPGVGYDRLNLTGDLQIEATSTNPFTLQLVSMLGTVPGPATNFDKDSACTWTIATTTRGVSGFAADKFLFDTTQFTNDLAGGVFSVALSSDGLSVNVVFTPDHAPVANPINYSRANGTFLRVPLQELLTNYTSDPDGDATRWVSLGASTNGSWVGTNRGYFVYAPTNNISESFCYIISDARAYRPGDTVRMATNWFTVTVTNALGFVQSLVPQGTNVSLRFAGIPGYSYDIERATNYVTGPWTVLWTTSAPPNGVWFYLDTAPPSGSAFYRTKQH